MSTPEPPFTLGMEEEYLLVDKATGALANDAAATIVAECEKRLAAVGQSTCRSRFDRRRDAPRAADGCATAARPSPARR